MKAIYFALITFSSVAALAASTAGHGDPHAIPTKLIVYQTINVALLVAGLIYFVRKPIASFFKEKRALFLSAAQKAETARAEAEQQRQHIQTKLSKLESTAEESIQRARAEAADMKKQLIAEAETLSKRIREEAQEAAKHEVQKAKNDLRETLLKEAMESARAQLSTKVTAEDHKRLQSDFLSHIQAVQK